MRIHATAPVSLLLAALSITSAHAHASLEVAEAPAGSYKAVLRIPHGCDGEATHTVRVELPEGFIGAKPMPKAGWELETEDRTYAQSYDLHGEDVSSGVTAITWSGGNLPDAHYDEFVISGTLAGVEPGDRLAFETVQICDNGEVAWNEIAETGQNPHSLDRPAPTVTIVAAEGGHGDHAGHGPAARDPGAPATLGELVISDYWSRATLPNQKVGGGYLAIENRGSEDDRLVSVSSPVTDRAEIHAMEMNGDVMTMRRLDDGLAIPAGETVELAPGGLHLMLQELQEGLVEGETVEVTLGFEKAGEVTLTLPILAIGAEDSDQNGHDHH